jgi:hypothetical protein
MPESLPVSEPGQHKNRFTLPDDKDVRDGFSIMAATAIVLHENGLGVVANELVRGIDQIAGYIEAQEHCLNIIETRAILAQERVRVAP